MVPVNALLLTTDRTVSHELQQRLTKLGFEIVRVASSEEEAFSQIQVSKPNLVLIDIRMKEAGERIQSTFALPVIYITEDDQDLVQRSRSESPFGYVRQPFDDQQLFSTIEATLTRYPLEKSKKWLKATLTSIGEGIIATDEQGRVQFINPAAMEYTGWTDDDAIGTLLPQVFSLLDEDSYEPIDLLLRQAETISHKEFEGILVPRKGTPFPIAINLRSIQDETGQVCGTVFVFRDITQQRETVREIRHQASRAEALMQVASQLNSQFELQKVLDEICKITYRTTEATGAAVFLLDNHKDTLQLMAAISQDPAMTVYHGSPFQISKEIFYGFLSRENPVAILQDLQSYPNLPYLGILAKANIKTLVLAALFYDNDLIGALILAFTNSFKELPEDEVSLLRGLADQASSAIKNAELFEQVRAGRERQRKLTKSLVDIQEAERRHIAQELHDHLGQLLTGLQFMLESVKKQASGLQRTHLEEIQESVSDVIRQVREMSLNLRPSMLDDLGLLPTLVWHIDRYTNQTGIKVNFHCDPFEKRLPLEIETAAYRIVQEALTNVARYAQVSEAFVGLVLQEDTLWVEILDKGKGFNIATVSDKPSSGLGGMRERASLLGGYLVVQSFMNQGTQILAALPLTSQPLERRKHDRHDTTGR